MLFCDIDYLAEDFSVRHGFVGVEGSRITYIGDTEPADSMPYGERYSGKGRLLMPGFYNTHAHAPMTLLRGYAEALNLQDWLNTKIFPFEDLMNGHDNYIGSLLAIAEMLRFGVVSYSDMYYCSEDRIRAITESGIKANVCPAITIFDDDTIYENMVDRQINADLARKYHGALGGRLRIDLNIHSEYLSNPQVVRAVGEQAKELGIGTQVHISETLTEHLECKERRSGKTPAEYFESLGFFEASCTAAHCVYTEPQDWEIFARNNVTVSANPASNFKLASGFAPLPQMIEAGVNVSLGTDGMASNNNHNMMKDLYLLATVYKAAGNDPTLIDAATAMRIATENGAIAQGRQDCGAISVGKKADLVVLDTDVPWMHPVSSTLNNIVYAAEGSDVVLTMVDGEVLYKDGVWLTIDIEKVIYAAQEATDRISSAVSGS